ncbi:MAG: PaaI family thioesterase [Deltaproteobacteria bacterium]|nr:PaaI family thioesterase [Deltaproteobacteria bacterium]
MDFLSPRAQEHEPLEDAFHQELLDRLSLPAFSRLLGLVTEEVRLDYCRMRLPYVPQHEQPFGVIHGGAIASLIDSAVIGAIFSRLPQLPRKLATIDLHVHYLRPLAEADAIAEAWVRRRGNSIIFLAVEVRDSEGSVVAHGELSYAISAAPGTT